MARLSFTLKSTLPLIAAALAIILTGCSTIPAHQASHDPHGRARYEILGMLDEYMGWTPYWPNHEGPYIDRFYESEANAANHFETVLREFCAEEALPMEWRREPMDDGAIRFAGKRIALAIARSYTEAGGGRVKASVMRSASRADMLRYVAGAYVRYGDLAPRPKGDAAAPRAFFAVANSYTKLCVLTDFLARLGCADLRCYVNGDVPTGRLLAFAPTAEVKTATGIRREITGAQIKKLNSGVRGELPRFP